jgi:hypothetical protein
VCENAEFDLAQLLKLVANPPSKTEDLAWCGHLDHYDEAYDKLSVRTARPLKRIDNKIFYGHVTTSDVSVCCAWPSTFAHCSISTGPHDSQLRSRQCGRIFRH